MTDIDLDSASPDVKALNSDLFADEDRRTKHLGRSPIRFRGRVLRQTKRLKINGREMKSDLEERAWLEWIPQQKKVVQAWYEPVTLHLAGGNYTPDLLLMVEDADAFELWFVEVKGSWSAYQSGRSSKRNLKQAAVEFAHLGRFFSLMPSGSVRKSAPINWKLEEMK